MDVHLVDLFSFVHEPWPRQLDRKLDSYSTCARNHPDAASCRKTRGYVTEQATLPIGAWWDACRFLCRIVRTGLRNRGISRPSRRFLSHKPTIGIRSGRAGLRVVTNVTSATALEPAFLTRLAFSRRRRLSPRFDTLCRSHDTEHAGPLARACGVIRLASSRYVTKASVEPLRHEGEPLRHEGEAPKEPTERSVHKQGERRGDGVAGIAHEQRGRDERRPAVAGGQRARRRGTSDVSI